MKTKQGDPIKLNLVNMSDPTSKIDNLPETQLWRGVIQQAVIDVTDPEKKVRIEALSYLNSDDLLQTMDYAQIDRRYVHRIRELANNGFGMQFRTTTFQTHKAA